MVSRVSILIVVGLISGACSNANDPTTELTELKTAMCKCADRSCTESVAVKTRIFSDKYKASAPTPAQMKVIAVVFDDLMSCRSKVTGMSTVELEAADAATDLVGTLSNFKDELCACKDAACAKRVDAKIVALVSSGEDATMTAGTKFAAAPTLDEMGKCRLRLTGHAEMSGVADDAIEELIALKDQMCACKDKACAERVTEEMMKMGEKHKDTKATESQMRAASGITEELTKCMSRAMGVDM
jgi:hypothetical protein